MTTEELLERLNFIVCREGCCDGSDDGRLPSQHELIRKLISDFIDAVLPPYRDEDTERDRGNNDVLDVIAIRKRNLLGEK